MTAERDRRLRELAALHRQWVADSIDGASQEFDPSGRKPGSDYNQHHVDIDASGAQQDAFFDAAQKIFAD